MLDLVQPEVEPFDLSPKNASVEVNMKLNGPTVP